MPKDIASLHLTHLSNLLVKSSHGHFTKDMARELRVLAQRSVGLNDSSLSIQIAQTLHKLSYWILSYSKQSLKWQILSPACTLYS